jgi:hypothetical protein
MYTLARTPRNPDTVLGTGTGKAKVKIKKKEAKGGEERVRGRNSRVRR